MIVGKINNRLLVFFSQKAVSLMPSPNLANSPFWSTISPFQLLVHHTLDRGPNRAPVINPVLKRLRIMVVNLLTIDLLPAALP